MELAIHAKTKEYESKFQGKMTVFKVTVYKVTVYKVTEATDTLEMWPLKYESGMLKDYSTVLKRKQVR